MEQYSEIIILVIALILDRIFGDPLWLPHPIIAMGKSISFFDKHLNKGNFKIFKGIITVTILVSVCYSIFFFANLYLFKLSIWAYLIFNIFFCFTALAGTTLNKECAKVFAALHESLDLGRKQLSFLVGRETSNLTDQEVKTATLETLAENLSDGVIAPIFWFAVGGLPLMMTYKMINTLDSMIAYRTKKYLEFGKCAAILDDVVNFFPARITALLMSLAKWSKRSFVYIFKYGHAHISPNSGYPESALAGILDVQFGGDHYYYGELIHKPMIGENKRNIVPNDIKIGILVNKRVEIISVLIVIFYLIIN